jgi:hypothetical protein
MKQDLSPGAVSMSMAVPLVASMFKLPSFSVVDMFSTFASVWEALHWLSRIVSLTN